MTDTSFKQQLLGNDFGKSSWTSGFFVDFLCVFCVFFIYAGSNVPAINEPHYWTKAAHFWNRDFAKGDLFLESGDAHWLFFATFGYLTRCMPLPWAVWTGRFVTWMFLAAGWTILGRSLWKFRNSDELEGSDGKSNESFFYAPLVACCWAVVWLAGLHYGHWAGEWVVGGCESKGIAYAMIFGGLAMAIRRRWTLAWTFLGGSAAFHVVTGIWVIACAGTISIALDWWTPKIGFWKWVAMHRVGWLLCIVGVLTGVVPAMAIDWGTDPVLASESAVKQVYTRLGHHLAPSRFNPVRWQDFELQLGCAAFLLLLTIRSIWRDGRTMPRGVRFAVGAGLFGFAVAMVGLLIDYGIGTFSKPIASKVLRFYLFRWNDVAMPLMIGALAVSFAFGHLRYRPYPALARWIVCCSAFLPGIVLLGYRFESNWNEVIPAGDKANFVAKTDSDSVQQKQFQDWLRVCNWIKENSESGSLWLTPRRQQSFKWHTGRPELACWKDAPQNAEDVVEWSKRLADAYQFDKAKNLVPWTTEKLWELQAKYGIRYVLLDRRVTGQNLPLLPILYPPPSELNESFAVFELTPPKANVSR